MSARGAERCPGYRVAPTPPKEHSSSLLVENGRLDMLDDAWSSWITAACAFQSSTSPALC